MNSANNTNNCTLPNILDSKLIVTTKYSIYDIKMVNCGDYLQVYFYPNRKIKNNKKDTSDLNLKNIKFNSDIKQNNDNKVKLTSVIEEKNIIRSKLECQRIAKSNINDWATFITLTFEENVIDIAKANKRFRYFIDKVKRVKKDFKYLCIPEFQKRGAVHYHLLTNVNINDKTLICEQIAHKKFYHIKYWNDGFTSVEIIKGDPKKIIGYIAKYMTKDIDNRLFNRHRYFYSKNLNLPSESFINLENEKEKDYYIKKIQDKELVYHNEYINSYDNSKVTFLELKK